MLKNETDDGRSHGMALVEALDWDTEFFGIPIGRVDLDGASDDDLTRAEAEARSLGLRCVYGSLDPADRAATWRVQEHGYRFVEAAVTWSLAVEVPPIPRAPDVDIRLGGADDLPSIEPMVDLLADWSRFAVDPRFGRDAARRMLDAWVHRAATSTENRSLLLAEDETGIIAFITRAREPEPIIDTIGTNARGSGAARSLVEVSREWAAPSALLGGPIAARNVIASRFVGQCGYRVQRVRYHYHRWLDEETPSS